MSLKYAISKPMYGALNTPSLDVKFSILAISPSRVLENNPKTILSFPDARPMKGTVKEKVPPTRDRELFDDAP